ncbi:MAG: phenylacetic acid degradation protein [Candidatus Rokuibacteriota bacterium]|nr:MAG: phenylacetic acid degradation protein [Candidatus Rokubacteria bacterium]
MTLAATEADLRRVLEGVAFTRSYGFRLRAIADGPCTLEVPFQAAFERPGGIVSGQVFMAAADVAMWLAIMTRLGPADESVTAGVTSAFLGAARREPFRCTARIVKLGRRLVYGVAESVGGDGRLLAHHTLTYARAAKDGVHAWQAGEKGPDARRR